MPTLCWSRCRALARDGLPIWGTCAGAIILARRAPGLDRPNLGVMDIGVERNAFGRQVDSFEIDLDVAALGDPPFHAVFIRAPVITDAGPDVTILARLPDGRIVAAREESPGHGLPSRAHKRRAVPSILRQLRIIHGYEHDAQRASDDLVALVSLDGRVYLDEAYGVCSVGTGCRCFRC